MQLSRWALHPLKQFDLGQWPPAITMAAFVPTGLTLCALSIGSDSAPRNLYALNADLMAKHRSGRRLELKPDGVLELLCASQITRSGDSTARRLS